MASLDKNTGIMSQYIPLNLEIFATTEEFISNMAISYTSFGKFSVFPLCSIRAYCKKYLANSSLYLVPYPKDTTSFTHDSKLNYNILKGISRNYGCHGNRQHHRTTGSSFTGREKRKAPQSALPLALKGFEQDTCRMQT